MVNKNVLGKFLSCVVLLIGITLFSSFVASATTYYVATNGDNSRTTTQAQNINTPWLTISKAASVMGAGDTCYIRGGTYTATSVARSAGWHELKFDYSSGDGLKMYIDNTLVSTTTDVKAFSYIRLGDMWSDSKVCTDSYFDDLTIQDIDTIQ